MSGLFDAIDGIVLLDWLFILGLVAICVGPFIDALIRSHRIHKRPETFDDDHDHRPRVGR